MKKATFAPRAMGTEVIAAIAAKLSATVVAQVPEGYEDDSGFHFGTPGCKN
jgi:hypothetical protein